MKVPVYGLKGEVKGEVTLGKAFSHPARKDLIRRAVVSEESRTRQHYGADPLAGKRTSAKYIGTRSEKGSMMNKEMARSKRITAGGYMHWRARFNPNNVKGRRAHPPLVEKVWDKKINRKEMLLALFSAVSCSSEKAMVKSRGHDVEGVKHIPLVLEDGFQELKKTSQVEEVLTALGLGSELERCSEKKTRAGRGKTRGRRNIRKKGPLIVVSEDKGISKAAGNIPGVDVSLAGKLKVGMLAPGTLPGRLTIWTRSAAELISNPAAAKPKQ